MIRKNKSAKQLTGSFVLPTSAKAHIHEPTRSSAYKAGQITYILEATQSIDDGGYPPYVAVTSDEPVSAFELGAEVATQHAEVRKNLPPRRVRAIVHPDGSVEGDINCAPRGLGLPHWEFVPTNPDGSASTTVINATAARIAATKEAKEQEKEAVRNLKKGAKPTASAAVVLTPVVRTAAPVEETLMTENPPSERGEDAEWESQELDGGAVGEIDLG